MVQPIEDSSAEAILKFAQGSPQNMTAEQARTGVSFAQGLDRIPVAEAHQRQGSCLSDTTIRILRALYQSLSGSLVTDGTQGPRSIFPDPAVVIIQVLNKAINALPVPDISETADCP